MLRLVWMHRKALLKAPGENSPQKTTHCNVNLYEIYKRSASRLYIPWLASQDIDGTTRDLYDGRHLPPHRTLSKRLLPMAPACLKNMKLYWDKPLSPTESTCHGLLWIGCLQHEGTRAAKPPAY